MKRKTPKPMAKIPPIDTLACVDAHCRHAWREHARGGKCYGTVKLSNGEMGDCLCEKFLIPRSER